MKKFFALFLTELCERYEIPRTKDRIIGHEEFSSHKSDPGELFDWSRLELDGRE
jgi:N-acetyl-anhydromuramyl-L-alanine amidase AmpD